MLRLIVVILLVANGAYLAWSQGWLHSQGFAPAPQSEPHIMARQLNPDAVKLLTPDEYKKVQALVQADLEPKQCLLAGPFDTAQVAALDQALTASLPPGGWQFESVVVPERWIIYFGKFASVEAQEKKRAELTAMRLTTQPLQNPSLEIGLSLAGFDTQAAAAAELAKLSTRGIRTARVVQERPLGNATYLKLPAVTAAMKARLNDIKPPLAGHSLKPCA